MKDYEHHVWDQYYYEDGSHRAWCGEKLNIVIGKTRNENEDPRIVGGEWVFLGANHAALSCKQGMLNIPCPKCSEAIIKALNKI